MTRRRLPGLFVLVLVALLLAYVARHTEWVEVGIPTPATGEARRNPFYAAQRFAEALGAATAWDRAFSTPPARAVVVVSSWHWTLSSRRREALERWVESGGRLIVDRLLLGDDEPFRRWSGVGRHHPELPRDDDGDASPASDEASSPAGRGAGEPMADIASRLRRCRVALEESATGPSGERYQLCAFDAASTLTATGAFEWALRDARRGLVAVRVPVGRGSVTVLNGTPFRERQLFEGDHAALFIAATQLRVGEEVRFLSEDDHPSLVALTWQHGGPAVAMLLALAGIAVWRQASRAGTLEAPPERARRSLAEQIRGTGRFILAQGQGDPLHAAAVRALQESMARRVPGYARLGADRQVAMLAAATGLERDALAAAIHHAARRRPQELRATLALLEEARRRVRTGHAPSDT